MSKRKTLVQAATALGMPWGILPRQPLPRDGETRKQAEDREGHRRWRLRGLFAHWHHTHNVYFAWEAICLSVEEGAVPPTWALKVLAKGMRQHLKRPDGDLAVQMGVKRRGSGTTPPHDEYRARYALDRAMMLIYRRKPGTSIRAAADAARKKCGLTQRAETLAGYYTRDWRPLFESLYGAD